MHGGTYCSAYHEISWLAANLHNNHSFCNITQNAYISLIWGNNAEILNAPLFNLTISYSTKRILTALTSLLSISKNNILASNNKDAIYYTAAHKLQQYDYTQIYNYHAVLVAIMSMYVLWQIILTDIDMSPVVSIFSPTRASSGTFS